MPEYVEMVKSPSWKKYKNDINIRLMISFYKKLVVHHLPIFQKPSRKPVPSENQDTRPKKPL